MIFAKPGYRIYKTVLAVFICLSVGKFINYGYPIFALFSCILMMKETPDLSIKFGINRSIGTVFGGLIATLALAISLSLKIDTNSFFYIFLICATLLTTLSLAKMFQLPEYAMSMASLIVVIIMINYNVSIQTSLIYSFYRIIETILGIVVAVAINITVKPLKK